MEIASIFEDVAYSEQHPAIKVLLNTPETKEVRITFKQHQEMKQHKSGYPIVVAVMEGVIDFGVGEDRHILKRGMLIALGANVPHDLKALENSIVRLSLNKSDSVERAAQAAQTQ